MKRKNIREFLDIKYENNIITVLIKHSDWAEVFKKLNQSEYSELNEQAIKELDPILIKLVFIMLIWVGFSIFIVIISQTIIQQELLKLFFNILVPIGYFTIILLVIYYYIKQERLKEVR